MNRLTLVTLLIAASTAAFGQTPVTVLELDDDPRELVTKLSGVVEPEKTVHLTSGLTSLVVAVPATIGQQVEKGQLLVELDADRSELAVARAQVRLQRAELEREIAETRLELAKLSMEAARAELAQVESMRERGKVSSQEVDEGRQQVLARQLELRQVELAFKMTEADIEEARLELELARRDLEATRVRSPISGVVAELGAAAGERVETGSPLVMVISVDQPRIVLKVPVAVYLQLEPGLPAEATLPSGELALKVAVKRPTLNPETGHGRVVYRIAGERPEMPVLPGMTCKVSVPMGQARGLIPRRALRHHGHVYLVRDGRIVHQPVEPIRELGRWIEVDGLEPGALIVVGSRSEELAEGTEVVVEKTHVAPSRIEIPAR